MIKPRNKVLPSLILIATAAGAATGFLSHAANRLVSGQPLFLWQVASTPLIGLLCLALLLLLVASFLPQRRWVHWGVAGLAVFALLMVLFTAGEAASALAATDSPSARSSLGAAFWILCLATALAILDALQRLRAGPFVSVAVTLLLAGAGAAMAASGQFSALSLAREYAARSDAFTAELGRHCLLVASAILPALLIGAPLGLWSARRPAARSGIFAALNLLQTIPSVALFGLLIAPLSALAQGVPALGAIGLRGIGFAPAVLALILYSLLPIARNTAAGIAGVDPAVIETADGMGFTPHQRFWRIELPLALPAFLAGLRIVLVQGIGLAVVAALIGAGGLGSFVFQGLGQYAVDLVLLGAVPAILLALAAHLVMSLLIALARKRQTS